MKDSELSSDSSAIDEPEAAPMPAEGEYSEAVSALHNDTPQSTAAPAPKKNRRPLLLAALLVVLALAFLIIYRSQSTRISDEDQFASNITLTLDEGLPDASEAADLSAKVWPADDMGFWHAQLSDDERAMYDEIYPHFMAHDEAFHLSGAFVRCVDETEGLAYYHVEEAILNDHPELFWINPWMSSVDNYYFDYSYYEDNLDWGADCTITYPVSAEDAEQIRAEMDEVVDGFLQTVPEDASDYEKALRAYLWLADHVTYDQEAGTVDIDAAAEPNAKEADRMALARRKDEQLADSALVDQLSVCSGYARAYQLLLTRMGIPCTTVTGDCQDGTKEEPFGEEEPHTWVLLCLSGRLGYCDPTWGDSDFAVRAETMDDLVSEDELEGLSPSEQAKLKLERYYETTDTSRPVGVHVLIGDASLDWYGERLEYFFMNDARLDYTNHWLDESAQGAMPVCEKPLIVGISGNRYNDWQWKDEDGSYRYYDWNVETGEPYGA